MNAFDDRLTSILPASAARIDIQGKANGSGFFVTPTDVLTCGHVLYQTDGIEVVDHLGKKHPVLRPVVVDAAADLARIKLASPAQQVRPALLGDAYYPGDMLYCFGYPQGKSEAPESYTFETEGPTGGNPPRIKFKAGKVNSGLSGSPLLNERTGAVCAVLSSELISTPGGYGIPVTVLLSRDGFQDLRALNQKVHADNRYWVDRLSSEQRRATGVERLVQSVPAVGLVIEVDQNENGWSVSATWSPDGHSSGDQTVDLNLVRSRVARLFRAWRSQRRIGDSEQARILGEVLYRSIFPVDVAAEFERRVRERTPIDLSLHFSEAVEDDLKYLPWEQLHTPVSSTSRQIPVGSDPAMTLARVLTAEPGTPAPLDRADLVTVVVTPPLKQRDMPTCASEVRDDVLALRGIAHLAVHDGKTPDQEALRQLFSPAAEICGDVLHYVGYGQLSGTIDEIALSGEYYDDPVEYVGPDDFADCLAGQPPRLVVLQACVGPDDPRQVPGDLSGFAVPLLKAGVAAVVVFQFPLSGREAARTFNRSFYKYLMNGEAVRSALQRARNDLGVERWALPALFEQQPGRFPLVTDKVQDRPSPSSMPDTP